MKLNKIFSLFLSLVVLSTCFAGVSSVNAAENVAVVTDSSAKINRYIYYPKELKTNNKKYPVIVWANGTGCQQGLYADLLKAFTEEGYIVVSSDETMSADGTDQIAGLDYVLAKSKSKKSIFYNRISSNKIVAMGHSQGGRSSVNCASADKRFCCVFSIAGSNYIEEAELLKAPALFLTGTSDRVVSSGKWVKPAYDACKGAAAYASLKGAVHTTCCNEPEKYVGYCVSWIKAWTDNDFKALSVFKSGGSLSGDPDWTDATCKNLTNNISGTIKLSKTEYAYDGKTKKPSVTVVDYRGVAISSSNYTVVYDKGCKNVGKYKITVKYRKNYTGSKSTSYSIVPKSTSISSLTAGSKSVTVKWKKQSVQTTGYEIQLSTNSKFTKNKKTIMVSKNSTTSKTVSNLKKNTKYYVRVRTYKTVSGKKYYSKWSRSETVKTK